MAPALICRAVIVGKAAGLAPAAAKRLAMRAFGKAVRAGRARTGSRAAWRVITAVKPYPLARL
jgi:hypothetical protein